MKAFLILLYLLAPAAVLAADWRQYASQPAVDYFFDGQSVKRMPDAFEVVIRLREKPGEDMATRVAVDCRTATFRQLDVGLVEDGRYVVQGSEPGPARAVGQGFVAPLLQGWCIAWSEPAGAVWHEFGKSASTTLYLDETPFKRNGDFDRGIEADFTATVKSLGGGVEKLQRLRIDCRAGRYEPLGGVGRQAGVVSRIEPGPAAAIQADTLPDMLKRLLCRQDVAERQRQRAELRRAEEARRQEAAGPCPDISSRLGAKLDNLKSRQSMSSCYQLNYDITELERLKSEAIRAGCGNYEQIDGFIHQIQKAPCN